MCGVKVATIEDAYGILYGGEVAVEADEAGFVVDLDGVV